MAQVRLRLVRLRGENPGDPSVALEQELSSASHCHLPVLYLQSGSCWSAEPPHHTHFVKGKGSGGRGNNLEQSLEAAFVEDSYPPSTPAHFLRGAVTFCKRPPPVRLVYGPPQEGSGRATGPSPHLLRCSLLYLLASCPESPSHCIVIEALPALTPCPSLFVTGTQLTSLEVWVTRERNTRLGNVSCCCEQDLAGGSVGPGSPLFEKIFYLYEYFGCMYVCVLLCMPGACRDQ